MNKIITFIVLGTTTLNLADSAQATAKPKKDVYYSSCSEAEAAGVTPIHKGEPGYRSGLDRDGDGVACEK